MGTNRGTINSSMTNRCERMFTGKAGDHLYRWDEKVDPDHGWR
jgi:hypothetical protein